MIALLVLSVVVAAVGFGIFSSSRWAGERGWVYNKHNPRPPGNTGTLGMFEEMFQPGIEHVVEERISEELRADQDYSGDGPR